MQTQVVTTAPSLKFGGFARRVGRDRGRRRVVRRAGRLACSACMAPPLVGLRLGGSTRLAQPPRRRASGGGAGRTGRAGGRRAAEGLPPAEPGGSCGKPCGSCGSALGGRGGRGLGRPAAGAARALLALLALRLLRRLALRPEPRHAGIPAPLPPSCFIIFCAS
jgi:hypothetical protein